MAESLFTTELPVSPDQSDGVNIVTATTLKFASAGNVTDGRFLATGTVGGTYTYNFWEVTGNDATSPGGTLLASKVFSGTPSNGNWNTLTLDSPVAVVTTKLYRAGIHNSQGRYLNTNNAFNGTSITNGNITAPASGADPLSNGWAIKQGTFSISATATVYPSSEGTKANYFADVVFTATTADAIAPDGLAVAVALGAPALSQVYAIAPDGVAVAVTLGAPSLSMAGIAPDGLAVAVALGAPSLTQAYAVTPDGIAVAVDLGGAALGQLFTLTPDGLAVPVTLGAPSLSQTIEPGFDIAPDGIAVAVSLGAPALSQIIASTGGWETLSAIVHEARADHERNAERRRNPIDCPEHGWPLERTSRGLHCKFGGHVVR